MAYVVVCLLLFLPSAISFTYCQQDVNCHLPDCFCATFLHPKERHAIPQMVYFAFDDGLRRESLLYFDKLFGDDRKNPNGCPVSISLFPSGVNTDYKILKECYQRGYEIAAHSVTHGHITTAERLQTEAKEQRENIANRVGISKETIIGWRSPYLETVGDEQVNILKKLGFKYDISLTYSKRKQGYMNPWPFTLDFGWPFPCKIPPCVNGNHAGFWEVPVNSMRDFRDTSACEYFDTCVNKTVHVDETYRYIMDNFRSHYHGNKAPFGLHMHVAWFREPNNMEAMYRAVSDMLRYDDVYIVNVKQVIAWMKTPTNTTDLEYFRQWSCSDTTFSNTMSLSEIIMLILAGTSLLIYIYVMIRWLAYRKK